MCQLKPAYSLIEAKFAFKSVQSGPSVLLHGHLGLEEVGQVHARVCPLSEQLALVLVHEQTLGLFSANFSHQ